MEHGEAFMVGGRVRNNRCSAMQSWEGQRELSQSPTIAGAGGQRTVGAVIEPHPTVASEKHVVLHGFGLDDVCPYGE